jgi:uncharacterized membrane protein YhhN
MLLLVIAGVVALVDWWAVAGHRKPVESVAKPLTMALLIAVAAVAGDVPGDVRAWLVLGAVFGLIGDIALLADGETRFMIGLGSFAIGHLAYVVAAVSLEFDPVWTIPGFVFIAGLLGYRFATRTLPGAIAHGGSVLGGAVAFYASVISAMVVTAWATTIVVAAVGAMLFATSDWVLGHRRFVGTLPLGPLAIMVPYHVGQALLVVGIATG